MSRLSHPASWCHPGAPWLRALVMIAVCLVGFDVVRAQSGVVPPSAPQTDAIEINEARFASAGIRKLVGDHVILFTDLARNRSIDGLPVVFDQGVVEIAKYFDTPPERYRDFRQTAFLMRDRSLFERLGCIPAALPDFLHGYQRGRYIWLYDQPSDYYRRHLLLHEATHAFMHQVLGGGGPPWYAEGIAELLGTHRWEEGELRLGVMPRRKQDVPYWGRIRTVRNEYDHDRGLSIRQILRTDGRGHTSAALYGWSWAVAAFLDGHPQFRDRFRQLRARVGDPPEDFTAGLEQSMLADRRALNEQWQLFVADIDYGYDFERAAVRFEEGDPLPGEGKQILIDADRGWQSSGIRLEPDRTYEVAATGRYQIAANRRADPSNSTPEIWWCEPGGVTIQYYRDYPLGMLLAKIRPDVPRGGPTNFTQPSPIGARRHLQPNSGGTLYFTINQHPAFWSNNRGQVVVQIRPLDAPP